jgi:hypothetical protein
MNVVARCYGPTPTPVNPITSPSEPADEHFGPALPNSVRCRTSGLWHGRGLRRSRRRGFVLVSVTRVGMAPNTRNISSEMTPGAVTKLASHSRSDSPRTHTTPTISAGNSNPIAIRPIDRGSESVWGSSNRRMTHCAATIIAISTMTASDSVAAVLDNRVRHPGLMNARLRLHDFRFQAGDKGYDFTARGLGDVECVEAHS